MRKRWLLLVPVLLIVVLLGAFLYLRSAFPPERLIALLEPRVEAALGREVSIASARLVAFPLAVRLDRVQVASAPGFSTPALLELGSLAFELRLLPLLRRQVHVRSLVADSPRVVLEENAARRGNFARSSPEAAPSPGAGGAAGRGPALALFVESFAVRGGVITVWSAPRDLALRLPVAAELQFRAGRDLRDVHVEGWIESDGVSGDGRGRLAKLRGLRVRLEPRLAADVAQRTARIETLRVLLGTLVLELEGHGALAGGRPVLQLRTRSEEFELAELRGLVPSEVLPQIESVRAAGKGRLALAVDLPAAGPGRVTGNLHLENGELASERWPAPLQGIRADIELAGDSLVVSGFEGKLGEAPLRIRGRLVRRPAPEKAAYDLELTTTLDLASVAKLLPEPPAAEITGRASADLTARGTLARGALPNLVGPITLDGVRVVSRQLAQPLELQASLRAEGRIARIDEAELRLGESRLALAGTLEPALSPALPRLALTGSADRLDLDAALAPAAAAGAGAGSGAPAPAGAPARSGGAAAAGKAPASASILPTLPRVRLDGTFQIGALRVRGADLRGVKLELGSEPGKFDLGLRAASLEQEKLRLDDVRAGLRGTPPQASGELQARAGKLDKIEATDLASGIRIAGTRLELPNLSGRAYDGRLRGVLVFDLADPEAPKQELALEVEEVQLGGLLGEFSQTAGLLSGSLSGSSTWRGQGSGSELRQQLSAQGQGTALNGRLRGAPLLHGLSQLLGLPGLENLNYRDLGFTFSVEAGRVQLPRLQLRAADADLSLLGSVGLDGTLDLGLNVLLSQELSKRYVQGRIGSAVGSLFADPDKRIMLDFRVGGTYRAPRLQPDLQKTASRSGLKALADTELRRFLGGLSQTRPGESPAERTLKDAASGFLGLPRPSPADTTRKP